MPVICIGPVCIPIFQLWALLLFLIKPLYRIISNYVQRRREKQNEPKSSKEEEKEEDDETSAVKRKGRRETDEKQIRRRRRKKRFLDGIVEETERMPNGEYVPISTFTDDAELTDPHTYINSDSEWRLFLQSISTSSSSSSTSPPLPRDYCASSSLEKRRRHILLFVKLTADWCKPCQRIQPLFLQIASRFSYVVEDFITPIQSNSGNDNDDYFPDKSASNTERLRQTSSASSHTPSSASSFAHETEEKEKKQKNKKEEDVRSDRRECEQETETAHQTAEMEGAQSTSQARGNSRNKYSLITSDTDPLGPETQMEYCRRSTVLFCTVDVDKCPQTAEILKASILPGFLAYECSIDYTQISEKNNPAAENMRWSVRDKLVGSSKEELESFVERHSRI